jgi:flagellin-like hook-associated protein FlgL
LTDGSVTSITDGSTGKTFTYTVPAAGATIAALQTAIAGAVTAGTLSAGTALSFNANGQAVISTTTAGDTLQVSTNDAALGQFSYTYNGTNDVNSVAVGDQLSVQVNLPGSQVFSSSSNNVLGSLSSLVTALQSGNSSDITSATAAVSSAISFIGQQQAFYSNAESQLNSQETFLQQDTVTLASQATNLIGVNLATAATNLTQAETDNSAALAAVAKVMPNTLLNYLEPPT